MLIFHGTPSGWTKSH